MSDKNETRVTSNGKACINGSFLYLRQIFFVLASMISVFYNSGHDIAVWFDPLDTIRPSLGSRRCWFILNARTSNARGRFHVRTDVARVVFDSSSCVLVTAVHGGSSRIKNNNNVLNQDYVQE